MITCMYVVIALHTKIVSQAWAKLHTQILSWISVMYGHHPYRTYYVKLFRKPLCTMLQFPPSVTEQPALTVGHHWCSSVSLQKETVSCYTYMYSRAHQAAKGGSICPWCTSISVVFALSLFYTLPLDTQLSRNIWMLCRYYMASGRSKQTSIHIHMRASVGLAYANNFWLSYGWL